MDTVEVTETFVSLQGESTWAGRPCFFVRLAGCNLRCRYCDTPVARSPGRRRSVDEIAGEFRAAGVDMAEITGGEPLLQPGFPALARALRTAAAGPVLVETNGSRDLRLVPDGVVAIVDMKCPGSGESAAMDPGTPGRLRPADEVKFVIGDRVDYEWARERVRELGLAARCHAVLFSPVRGVLEPGRLGAWILEDRLPVHLQIQLHALLGLR